MFIIKVMLLLHLGLTYYCTIDINAVELQYLADHLTEEECRRLVAAAHFKSYEVPNPLDQAERKIPKDLSCIDLLHHWNSNKDEGKGETHEALEHRLRQLGKTELADWLGKTVFRELGRDLNRSFEYDFTETTTAVIINSTAEFYLNMGSLQAIVEGERPTWTPLDTIVSVTIVGIVLLFTGLCCIAIIRARRKKKERYLAKRDEERKKKTDGITEKIRKSEETTVYSVLETTSGSESEDRFDILRENTKICQIASLIN
ncbi:unnamed protein product [Callosobruchus maculatus]|uniref:Death domain-containing protein n=1 Tax=Callosobruchus maculatus TaxID=64391 RepID=A0A653BLZ1_CALMS|nr:unnamed protein product [Callosobruchus maculatus]